MNAQRMTSLEIAQVIGKQHKNVMQAIRNMEPAWESERGLKFQLTQIREAIITVNDVILGYVMAFENEMK